MEIHRLDGFFKMLFKYDQNLQHQLVDFIIYVPPDDVVILIHEYCCAFVKTIAEGGIRTTAETENTFLTYHLISVVGNNYRLPWSYKRGNR